MLGTGLSMTKEKLVPFTNNLAAPPRGGAVSGMVMRVVA